MQNSEDIVGVVKKLQELQPLISQGKWHVMVGDNDADGCDVSCNMEKIGEFKNTDDGTYVAFLVRRASAIASHILEQEERLKRYKEALDLIGDLSKNITSVGCSDIANKALNSIRSSPTPTL